MGKAKDKPKDYHNGNENHKNEDMEKKKKD